VRVEDWGLVEYGLAVERQLGAVEEVASGEEERLVLCSHPPVVTLGRAATAADLTGWRGATHESSRGGRATYHGPNQIVIYPIADLRRERQGFAARDVHAYLRALEAATVEGLHRLGLADAEARTTRQGELSLTGVWIGEHKIASIGIAVRKWTTYHGVAVNLTEDPTAFSGIRPCGFAAGVMTSLERELGRRPDVAACRDVLGAAFLQRLG
jgi:lipoyl(octanoyl) transferase